jgi:hypothetical protein
MADPTGISLAFGDDTLEPNPVWTRIDDPSVLPGVRVAGYQIDRGRASETTRTEGGSATVTITDRDGALDPTNPTGPFTTPTNKIQPLVQAAICRWNPVDLVWDTRFRGWVAEYDYTFDPSQQVNQLQLTLVDIFEILATVEMYPGGDFGDPPPAGSEGQVYYGAPATVDQANYRIERILTDARLGTLAGTVFTSAFAVVFSLNVNVWPATYSPGETALAAIQETVDAELPEIANAFTDRFGRLAVHGRQAKFNPGGVLAGPPPIDNTVWDWHHWYVGDGDFVNLNPAAHAQIRQFAFNHGRQYLANSAMAYPVSVTDATMNGQVYPAAGTATPSKTKYGIRSWSAPNLITAQGRYLSGGVTTVTDALTETHRFAQYKVANYGLPVDRITTIGFRPLLPADPRAGAVHRLLGKADISDQVDVTVPSPGGGGFNGAVFFIEGIHETCTGRLRGGVAAGAEGYDDVTLTLDVSPGPVDTSMFTPPP